MRYLLQARILILTFVSSLLRKATCCGIHQLGGLFEEGCRLLVQVLDGKPSEMVQWAVMNTSTDRWRG